MEAFDLWAQLPSVLPEVGLTALAVIVLFADIYGSVATRRNVVFISAVGMALLALAPLIWTPDPALFENGVLLWGGMVNYDPLAQIFKVMLLLAGAVTCLMALGDKGVGDKGEFYLIVIVATLGGLMMSSASDLILVFVALETLSIPLYMLASFRRGDLRSAEGGMKYFLYGSFASAIMLFGFSLLYGFAGTTNLGGIAAAMSGGFDQGLLAVMAALVMVVVGFGFKLSAVPFHFWTPDVYEGAPTPVTAFMSVTAKIGGFAAMLRLLVTGLATLVIAEGEPVAWQATLSLVAVLTLVIGNFVAISQRNLKRMLAYSSIAHAGYILVAVAASGSTGVADAATQAALVYMLAYMFTNLGAFAVVMTLEKTDGSGGNIEDITGLARSRPLLAMAMTIFMLSLTGIPLTAGFLGKFMVFASAVQAGLFGLAVIGVLTSVVSAFYYMRVVVNMYLRDSSGDLQPALETPAVKWAINIALAGTMIFGVFYPLATNLVSSVSIT